MRPDLPGIAGETALSELAATTDLFVDYGKIRPEQARKDAETYFKAWKVVLERNPAAIEQLDPDDKSDLDARWRKASLGVGRGFVSALSRADSLMVHRSGDGWFPFTVNFIQGLNSAEYGYDAAVERRLLSEYLQCTWNCNFMEVIGSPALGGTPQGWDAFIFWSIQAISEVAAASAKAEHMQLAAIMTAFLARRARKAAEQRDRRDFTVRDRVLGSFVVVRELHLLAARNESMIERYGEKHVEKRFEQQLSLLLQSLGFVVVTADTGEKRVDLICFAPGSSSAGYSMLVEAKSTKNKYSLPTKDARAIEEYVADARGKLTTLPPLKIVLIVGPDTTDTIASKIRSLEGETGVPVRYLHARTLAWMRDRLPGPLPLEAFLRAVLNCGPFVTLEAIKAIVEADGISRSAHADFVKALLHGKPAGERALPSIE
ncbi:hypothetical protein ABZU53_27980 [Micromonospora sp. NPDC005194]|uniref:hypothetical protein n=1 Tax=Micromonospora sp. NPDC005194 TaxID=3156870 RepID=UPI0033A75A62